MSKSNNIYKYKLVKIDNNIQMKCINNKLFLYKNNNEVLLFKYPTYFNFEIQEQFIVLISSLDQSINARKIFIKKILGTYKSIIINCLQGFIKPFCKSIEIKGIGYKFILENTRNIKVFIGRVNQKVIFIPEDINFSISKNNLSISFSSINKQKLGEICCKFLTIKKFNVYNLSGIKYANQYIAKKEINKK